MPAGPAPVVVGSGNNAIKKPKPVLRDEDAIVELPFNTSGLVWDWVNTLVGPNASVRKQVVLSELNSSYSDTQRRLLTDTRLTVLERPALDATPGSTARNTLVSMDLRGLNVSGLSALGTKVPNGILRTRVVLNVEGATFGTVGP